MSGICKVCQKTTDNAYIYGVLRVHTEYMGSGPANTRIFPVALVEVNVCDDCGTRKLKRLLYKNYFHNKSMSSIDSSGIIPMDDIIAPQVKADIITKSWQKNSLDISGTTQSFRLVKEKNLRNSKYISFMKFLYWKNTGHATLNTWLEQLEKK